MESRVADNPSQESEICFCKVKLFRDKGAERKNKDDAKQISKQLEKVYGKANEQSLPLMYNVSLPYSVFGEIPTSSTLDSFEHAADDLAVPSQLKTPARYHTRVMTAPNSLFYQTHRNNQNTRGRKPIVSSLSSFPSMSTVKNELQEQDNFISKTKENYDFQNYLNQQQQALASLPNIDTNTRHARTPSTLYQQPSESYSNSTAFTASFDDDLPPLTADIHTPGTQVTPTDLSHAYDKKIYINHVPTPDLMMDFQPMMSSIYDVFTPEEIQQPPEGCIISPSQEDVYSSTSSSDQQRDYFCSMETSHHISLLQQQLQLHNETASNIMMNNSVSNLLLLSPPPALLTSTKKRSHSDLIEHQDTMEESRILTYSSNPSHITLSSNCSSTSSNCSIKSETTNHLVKKLRYSP